ncbi:MAG: two-component system, NtrC family, response regulator PilR [Acidobacteriota bacterium]|nr:two-component system, NtrC family, response regulator PilR [Acidobacteriota bacterium]
MFRGHSRTHSRPPAGTLSRDEAVGDWKVLVWDEQGSRLQSIKRIIEECGARACVIEDLKALEKVKLSAACNIALVALGHTPSPEIISLQVIRALKQKGFIVIAHENEAEAWPLGTRCRPLLAGSAWLLDSARSDFAEMMSEQLAQALTASAARRSDAEKTRSLMKQLGIIGESQALIALFHWIIRLSALSDLSILITGETGTGKELLARAAHQLDPKRCHGPLVVLNCGAISPWLAESELFGHRRGAFTGAERDRKGLIRAAEGGVLFLDEIGELDLALQTKLLRVLQEDRVLGVGEDHEVAVNVRIIAATNRNLAEMVEQGKFRADLFHRLNTLSAHIPPLRERPADLRPLIDHFTKKYRPSQAGEACAVGLDFLEALARIELPGNARQLENIVRNSLVNKADDSPLELNDLPPEVWQELSEQAGDDMTESLDAKADSRKPAISQFDAHAYLSKLLDSNGWNLSRSLEHCERLLIESALRLSQGNQSKTARLLGITPRSVYNKVRKHQLHYE